MLISRVQSRRRRRQHLQNRIFSEKDEEDFGKLGEKLWELVHRQKMSWEKRRKKFLISHADHLQRQEEWKCGSRRHLKIGACV